MGCGCNKTRVYEVTKSDGSKEEVKTLGEAMNLVRKFGGSYKTFKK